MSLLIAFWLGCILGSLFEYLWISIPSWSEIRRVARLSDAITLNPPELYYVQRVGYQGHCLCWWKENGLGYTIDLNQAWKVPHQKAIEICRAQPEWDRMWLAARVDEVAQRHVTERSLP